MRRFYFGGQFRFKYKDCTLELLAQDYRSKILGDKNSQWINRPDCGYIDITDDVQYGGPFYFYDQINSDTVVKVESSSIEAATDCIFVLSNDDAPGTVTEIIQATMLGKKVHIFYEMKDIPKEEVSSRFNSNLWYAITFASFSDNCVCILGYETYEDAVKNCVEYFNNNFIKK